MIGAPLFLHSFLVSFDFAQVRILRCCETLVQAAFPLMQNCILRADVTALHDTTGPSTSLQECHSVLHLKVVCATNRHAAASARPRATGGEKKQRADAYTSLITRQGQGKSEKKKEKKLAAHQT